MGDIYTPRLHFLLISGLQNTYPKKSCKSHTEIVSSFSGRLQTAT